VWLPRNAHPSLPSFPSPPPPRPSLPGSAPPVGVPPPCARASMVGTYPGQLLQMQQTPCASVQSLPPLDPAWLARPPVVQLNARACSQILAPHRARSQPPHSPAAKLADLREGHKLGWPSPVRQLS